MGGTLLLKESKRPKCRHDAQCAPRVVSSDDASPQRRHRHRQPMRKHKTAKVVVETPGPMCGGYHHRFWWWWWQKKERRTKRRRRRRARRRRRRRREKCFNKTKRQKKKEYFYYGRICQFLCFLRTRRLFAQQQRESSGRMGGLCTGVRRLERRVLGAAKD